MNPQDMLALLHQFLPPHAWDTAQKWVGDAALIMAALAKGPAWALAAADWVANLVLASPLRPLVLWALPTIVRYMRKIKDLLEQVLETFESHLEQRLEDAAKTAPPAQVPSPAPAQSAPASPAAPATAPPAADPGAPKP